MELALLVYVISLLSGLQTMFGVLFLTLILVLVVISLYYFVEADFDGKKEQANIRYTSEAKAKKLAEIEASQKSYKFGLKMVFTSALLSAVCLVLIPSEKTAWIMVGAYAAQKIVTSPEMQNTNNKIITIINNKLDSYITKEMK